MDFRGKSNIRGIRNNNPGNIRVGNTAWQGKVPLNQNTDKVFEQFTSMVWGLRALMRNFRTWHSRGFDTIRKAVSKWAPNSDKGNDESKYAKKLQQFLPIGIDEKIVLTKENLITIAKGICEMENGDEWKKIPANLFEKAYELESKGQSIPTEIKKK